VLEAGGQRVTREYYFNDSGGQIRNLGASVAAIRRDAPIPEDGYHGAYVADLAAALPDEIWQAATAPGADTEGLLGQWAAERVRTGIEASLETLGVHFDVWKSEASLHAEGWVERAIDRLRERGHVYEQDGALWFRSTAFGDDKDRVIIRSNGAPTYFAADIGYVTEKLSRGFDHLIYIWGADHHGTVARLRNAAEAMGYDKEAVQVLLYSWVRFVRDGVEVSMSKRAGDFVTSTSCWPRSASMPRAGSSPHARPRPASTSTSSSRSASRVKTPSTTSSTRTLASPRSCARLPSWAWHPRRR
jgi:arginyl-tRNA synthetase